MLEYYSVRYIRASWNPKPATSILVCQARASPNIDTISKNKFLISNIETSYDMRYAANKVYIAALLRNTTVE